MLISSIISKNFLKNVHCNVAEPGHKIVFKEIKPYVKFRNLFSLRSCNKIMRISSSNQLLQRTHFVGKSSSHACSSTQTAVFPKKQNEAPISSIFQEMMHARKTQAHRSVLIAVADKADIPFAVACCEKYGSITNTYLHFRENENCFLLVEFSSETSVHNLLLNCGFRSIDKVFPVSSRMIQYEKKLDNSSANVNMKEERCSEKDIKEERCSELSSKSGANISEFIEKIYLNEKLTELDTRLRFFLCSLMKDSISSLFPYSDVLPFGSTINGFGKHDCDLDIAIRLYPEKMNGDKEFYFLSTGDGNQKILQQKTHDFLGRYFLFSPGVVTVKSKDEKVKAARVPKPIQKKKHKILNMDFDILSVNNMAVFLITDMLYFCGEIDSRIRPLVHVVKKWAKESNITQERLGNLISNFGLTNLILFFLQSRLPHPILPPLNDAFHILGSENSYDFRLQYLKSLDEWKNYASLNKEPLAMLLKEFLVFLSSYPFHGKIISLLSGGTRTREKDSVPLYVEYPLDETLNITKNVSKDEYDAMCEKARVSANYLEKNFNQTVKSEKDFFDLLGIPAQP